MKLFRSVIVNILMQIQSIYVKQGDTVKTGQSLGKVYTDPDTGYSQMHFQLWQGTNKMNPEPWLR